MIPQAPRRLPPLLLPALLGLVAGGSSADAQPRARPPASAAPSAVVAPQPAASPGLAPSASPAASPGYAPGAAPPAATDAPRVEPAPPKASAKATASAAPPPPPPIEAPRPPPPPSASAAAPLPEPAPVKLDDAVVFSLRASLGGKGPKERADAATAALLRAADEKQTDVHVADEGGFSVVYAGPIPIVQIGPDDAVVAGDVVPSVTAANIRLKLEASLRSREKRGDVVKTVIAVSLLVLSFLGVFFLLRKIGDYGARSTKWLQDNPERVRPIALRGVEVVGATALRGVAEVGATVGTRLVQVLLGYGWILFALSLFPSTRGYSERLSGFVFGPIGAFFGRIGGTLPVLAVAAIALAALGALLRFARLFFGAVGRGETSLPWLAPDLAPAASVLVRAGIVVGSVLLVAPLMTGTEDNPLSRVALAALLTVALGLAPTAANATAGAFTLFGRRLRTGDFVTIGVDSGKVVELGLHDVVLEDSVGGRVRVAHLTHLLRPMRVAPMGHFEASIEVDPTADLEIALDALEGAIRDAGGIASVDLVTIDGASARIVLHVRASSATEKSLLVARALRALDAHGVRLARRGA